MLLQCSDCVCMYTHTSLFFFSHHYAPSPSQYRAMSLHQECPWKYLQSYRGNPETVQWRTKPNHSDGTHQDWHCRGSFRSATRSCLHALSESVHFNQIKIKQSSSFCLPSEVWSFLPQARSFLIPEEHQYFSGLHTWWGKQDRTFLFSPEKSY